MMLKEALLHMLFIGAVVCAAYFLKKNNISTTALQASAVVMDDDYFPYTPVSDTLKLK